MPLKRDPVNSNVLIEWRGDDLNRRAVRGMRAGINQQAKAAQALARQLVNKDTLALHDAITFRAHRGYGGTYRVEFGVFDDEDNRPRVTYYVPGFLYPVSAESALAITNPGQSGGGGTVIEYPQDYAFWQEVDPERGNPYIRPAVDAELSGSPLFRAIAGNIFYQRSGYGSDRIVDVDVDASFLGLSQ